MQPPIPILIYHGFYRDPAHIAHMDASERRYYLPVPQFARHVDCLAHAGFSVRSIERAAGPREIAFSFDDGHISNYTGAWPLLTARGFSATFFIVGGWVGRAGRIGAPQLREMVASGMSIGSHGLTHVGLAGLPPAELDRELTVSKDQLEQLTGAEVSTLALPRGLADRSVFERARAAGYRRVCTSRAGLMGAGFEAPRLSVTSYTGDATIVGYARRDTLLLARTRLSQAARLAAKRAIGVGGYEALCRVLLKSR